VSASGKCAGDNGTAAALKAALAIACGVLLLAGCSARGPVTNRPIVHRAAHRVVHARTVAKASIPMPDPSLLQPQSAPECTFGGSESDSTTGEGLRMKLDYEQQCYRQAEEITRTRLQQLQQAVDRTIRATKLHRR
jgi:hypothetical protein